MKPRNHGGWKVISGGLVALVAVLGLGVPSPSASGSAVPGGPSAPDTAIPDSTAAGWSLQRAPEPAVPDGFVFGVSCMAPRSCIGVGRHIDFSGTWATLAEAWDGTTWSIQSTPNPTGSTHSELDGVSCTATDACTAVGFFNLSSGKTKTLAEAWDGTTWSIQSTPNPPDAAASELASVSCTAADACTAVGTTYTRSSGKTVPLAETWNGTAWSIQSPPGPTGDRNGYLQGVSCTAADACTAAGYSLTPAGVGATLAEAWNGTAWTIQSAPDPAGAVYSALSGLSCTSADACTAVGSYVSASRATLVLAERWDGTNWTIQSTPNPAGSSGSGLSAVSCTAADACTAVGSYTRSSGRTVSFAETWNGTTWKIEPTPDPKGATRSYLLGVSCNGGDCSAAGYDISSAGIVAPLAVASDGTSWTIEAMPNPPGAITSGLTAVSCAATDCAAVGSYYIDTSGVVVPLAEAWNGTAWQIRPIPNPAGATSSQLSAVSCTAADACTAVGYGGGNSGLAPLAEAWDGTAWQIRSAPSPPGATDTQLAGVSCTADSCTAVGQYVNSSRVTVPLAEVWNGTSWQIQSTPAPAGATSSELSGVSCTAADACTAVGSYADTSAQSVPLAERWSGASWTVESTPAPAGAARGSDLQGVSCAAASVCTAVGSDTNADDVVTTLVETSNGSSWGIQTSPNGSGSVSELTGVSCRGTKTCTAVGFDSTPGMKVTLAEAWDGTTWTTQPTPNPPAAPVSELTGVSCTAAACIAAGFHTKPSGIGTTLAESEG